MFRALLKLRHLSQPCNEVDYDSMSDGQSFMHELFIFSFSFFFHHFQLIILASCVKNYDKKVMVDYILFL